MAHIKKYSTIRRPRLDRQAISRTSKQSTYFPQGASNWRQEPRNRVLRSKTTDGAPYVSRPSPNPPLGHSHHDHPRPKPPTRAQTYDTGAGPWIHMANTYAWVAEQEHAKQKKNRGAADWVLQQQIFVAEEPMQEKERVGRAKAQEERRQQLWKEMMGDYRAEAERWVREQEEARRRAVEQEMERLRRMKDEHVRVYERERREQEKANQTVLESWRSYDAQWNTLRTSSGALSFGQIPWPLVRPPSSVAKITPAGIVMFLFSPAHSSTQSRKDRIKAALLRWHPDRFRRLLDRVVEQDKKAVEEGVGIVARCLNDLMARETKAGQYVK